MTPIPCLSSLTPLLSLLSQPVLLGKRHGTAWAKRRGNQESLGYAEKSKRAWSTQMETWDSLGYMKGETGQPGLPGVICETA